MSPNALAISPDGRTIVFSAVRDGTARLYRRALGAARADPITGTDFGYHPFFSPDGQWIAYFSGEELKKVPLSGGPAVTLARVPPSNPGATWGRDGRIVYTRAPNGELWWVSEAGGQPQRLTQVGSDSKTGDQAHLFPQFLPGDRALLFTVRQGRDFQEVEKSSIAVLEVPTGKRRILLEGATFARYGGGRLVFLRGDRIFSAPFDASRLEVTGPVSALEQSIATDPNMAMAVFDVSAGGTLVFVDGPPLRYTTTEVLQVNRAGKVRVLPLPTGLYLSPRFSPDGKRVTVDRLIGMRGEVVVWDEERGILSTLTPEPGRFYNAIWSPDGTRIAFSHFRSGPPSIGRKRSDGGGEIDPVTRPSENAEIANSWSPDGKTIAYTMVHMTTGEREPIRKAYSTDIWLVNSDGSQGARPWFETPFHESAASFSPDGKWIAYVSDESGTDEVFVRSYPDGGTRVKISREGQAEEPVWTRGGREFIYRAGEREENFMAVDIASPTWTPSVPRLLFTADLLECTGSDQFREYDASADGNDFVALRLIRPPEPERRLIVVTDWASNQPR